MSADEVPRPMTFVTTTCAVCGTVEIPLADVVLRVCEDDGSGRCVIRCPECGSRFTKFADEPMMVVLMAAGIEVVTWRRPAEVDERPTHLGAITPEELDAFGRLLESDDALRAFGLPEGTET